METICRMAKNHIISAYLLVLFARLHMAKFMWYITLTMRSVCDAR